MGTKRRHKIKLQKQWKRRLRRQKLAKNKTNPDDVFFGGYYVGPHKTANTQA